MTSRLNRLAEVHDRYDALFCDVWGVLHNGVEAWSPACDALSAARAGGLAVILITNSPRPGPEVVQQLDAIGVPHQSYDRIVTSGDVTRKLIAEGPKKVFFLGLDRDLTLLDGLGAEVVGEAEAEVIVCTGPYNDETDHPDDYRPMLEAFRLRNVPFICANPDLVVERGEKLVYCAGAIAAVYARLGGETRVSGKPHKPIYEAACVAVDDVRGATDTGRILAIGDGMPTDVKGAQDFGLDLLYIAAGIHARDYTGAREIDLVKLEAFLGEQQATPRYWMPRLV